MCGHRAHRRHDAGELHREARRHPGRAVGAGSHHEEVHGRVEEREAALSGHVQVRHLDRGRRERERLHRPEREEGARAVPAHHQSRGRRQDRSGNDPWRPRTRVQERGAWRELGWQLRWSDSGRTRRALSECRV